MSQSPAPLSSWARQVAPSPTLAVDAKAKALQAAGEDVCGFAAGEPDFDTPEHIKEACIAALRGGKTKYAPTPGIEPLRAAIAERYFTDYGHKVVAGQVVVSPGGKFSCYLGVMATCSPGDEVIVPAPFWVSYPEMVKLAGAVPRLVLADDRTGFKLTPAQLEAAITPRTKLLILNSPSNPTGCRLHPRGARRARRHRGGAQSLHPLRRDVRAPHLRRGAGHVRRHAQPGGGGPHPPGGGFFEDLLP